MLEEYDVVFVQVRVGIHGIRCLVGLLLLGSGEDGRDS